MSATGVAVLIVGSPRVKRSSSASLGDHLMGALGAKGFDTRTFFASKALRDEAAWDTMLTEASGADLLVLSFPLYVDALPSPMVKALEDLATRRMSAPRAGTQRLLAITQCGFPEAVQLESALAICNLFADRAGYAWAGGLGFGGGAVIDGRPLKEVGGAVRHMTRALDLTAEALSRGEAVPQEAMGLSRKQVLPSFLYRVITNRGWKARTKGTAAEGRLRARPYDPGKG